MKKGKKIDVFEMAGKENSLSDLLLIQSEARKSALKKPTLKHKYIRFEIEKGTHSFSHNKVVGFYYEKQNDGSIKEIKDNVFSTFSSANNPILDLLMPILDSIAFGNLSEFSKDKEKYFLWTI